MAALARLKPKSLSVWVFKTLVALIFVVFGSLKLMGAPMLVHEFDVIGLGQGFRLFTGAVEVTGGIMLLLPATSRFGAIALLGVSIGAFIAQATRLHGDVFHTLVLIAATGSLCWITWRPRAGPTEATV